ncbi:hypothetical protein [Anaerorhabdus sp.]|jgi:hypothetical protein|uniref:hypothetical protein n=1 Tax=Anaerorhabdus sp. TaxID=1872524 RepID=UPI002FC7E8CF
MFEWIPGNAYSSIVTLYPNNFTLNNTAASYFADVRWCCIGLDKKSLKIAIKPITKREIDLNLVPLDQLHKVSVGKGYARISNKPILDEISILIQKDCNGIKLNATFDEKERMLIIDLKESS